MWESPLLAATLSLQGAVAAFAMTMLRFASLARLAFENALSDETIEPYLTGFSREVTHLRRIGFDAYEDLAGLLRTLRQQSEGRVRMADEWLARLEELCSDYLFSLGGSVTITPSAFADWATQFEKRGDEAKGLFSSIVEFAIAAESACGIERANRPLSPYARSPSR